MRTLAVAILVLALAGCGGDDKADRTPATTEATTVAGTTTPEAPLNPGGGEQVTLTAAYADGKLEGGVKTLKVKEGDHVVLDVTSDVEDEVHVHGGDVSREVGPDAPAHVEFNAPAPGRYAIELEEHGVQLVDLQVEP